jgi:hypothetical protein
VFACGGEPEGLRLVETAAPAGSDTLQYEVEGSGAPAPIRLWPQEGVSIDGRFAPVRRDQVVGLGIDAGGAISYRVEGLADGAVEPADGALELAVRIRPAGERIELLYEVANRGPRARFVSIAPCLQLPAAFFGDLSGWAHAKRVFVVTEDGPRWIADTEQARGLARPGEPEPGDSPWAQHFRARGAAPPGAPPPEGLALFGVARERVVLDGIGASLPGSDLLLLALADSKLGVTYGLLDCLHAGLGGRVAAGASASFRQRIVFSRGSLEELLRAEAPEAGGALRAGRGFVPPRAAAEVLESFERGIPDGWSAPGGSLGPARPRLGFRAPPDGVAQLEVVLGPTVALQSPEFVIPASPAWPSWLSLDVSAAGLEQEPALSLVLVGPDGEQRATGRLAHGKPRRLVAAVPDAWLGAPLSIRLELHDSSVPRRFFVDAFALHRLEEGAP